MAPNIELNPFKTNYLLHVFNIYFDVQENQEAIEESEDQKEETDEQEDVIVSSNTSIYFTSIVLIPDRGT